MYTIIIPTEIYTHKLLLGKSQICDGFSPLLFLVPEATGQSWGGLEPVQAAR